MDEIHIYVLEDKKKVAETAAELWEKYSFKAVDERGIFTAALSGGSTPLDFYELMASSGKTLPWDKTHIFIVDERFVPCTHMDSNYRMINEALITPVGLPPENIHCVPVDEGSARDAASRYKKDINEFFGSEEKKLPGFDLVMLGLGEDGHTASLFPGHEASRETSEITSSVRLDRLKNERVTITMPVINNAKQVIFMISGSEKADIVKKVVIEKDLSFPASHVDPVGGELIFLMDKEAGEFIP